MDNGIRSGERFLSQSDIFERAARAATGLEELGVGLGDAVALMLRNDIAYAEASLAAAALGAYPVPINWHWRGDEVGYLLADSGAKALVIHADLLPVVDEPGVIPEGTTVLVVETPPELAATYHIAEASRAVPGGSIDWTVWLGGFVPRTRPADASPLTMIYTSGTTGRPKGVQRQQSTPDQAAAINRMLITVLGITPGIRAIVPAPLYHSAPNAYVLSAAVAGTYQVLMPRFDPEDFLALVERESITHVQMVPTMFVRLLKLPPEVRGRYDLSSLQFVVHAAAPCPPDVKRAMIDWWGPIVHEYYGCTESGGVTFCTADEWLSHPGTVGRAIEGAVVRIVGDDGHELPAGQTGDVYVRIQGMPDFTYRGQDAKRRAIERQGLITCGDMGYLDADGFLYLNDRRNDMVISGGVNVYPAEIESVLLTMPEVADCAVFGIPDDEFGEALAAVVQPRPGSVIEAEEVRSFLRERVAGYKVPKVVELRDELPREDTGKIFKRRLREPYWAEAGRRI